MGIISSKGKFRGENSLVTLPLTFVECRRDFYTRNIDYLNKYEQKNCFLSSSKLLKEIFLIIVSYLQTTDCVKLSLCCKVFYYYWFGDQEFWFHKISPFIQSRVVKYQPFCNKEINVNNWKELCLHLTFNAQWKCLLKRFQIVEDFVKKNSSRPLKIIFYTLIGEDGKKEELTEFYGDLQSRFVYDSLFDNYYEVSLGEIPKSLSRFEEQVGFCSVVIIHTNKLASKSVYRLISGQQTKNNTRIIILLIRYNSQDELYKTVLDFKAFSNNFELPLYEVFIEKNSQIEIQSLPFLFACYDYLFQKERNAESTRWKTTLTLERFLLSYRKEFFGGATF
ncbi:hypothetical protein ABK040_003515 [Willaertia magna]